MDYVTLNYICSHLHYLYFISIFLYNPQYLFTFHATFLPANLLVLAVIFNVLFYMSLVLAR